MRKNSILIILAFFTVTICAQFTPGNLVVTRVGDGIDASIINTSTPGELIFQSGFEPTVQLYVNNYNDALKGKDNTLSVKNDWIADLEQPLRATVYFDYTGGDVTKRFAKIVTDPLNANNNVLEFSVIDTWLNTGGETKGRVQMDIYDMQTGLKEFYQSVRVYLPTDMNLLKNYNGKITWFTIAEFWNNTTWTNTPYPFRVSLSLKKPTIGVGDLFFSVDGQDFDNTTQKYTNLWGELNDTMKVPIGKWFTMDYYYKEGNGTNGKFYLAITPDGEATQVVFNLTRFTHNSQDTAPNGVTHFNPLKLYTSKELVAYMKAQGKPLQIFWDDFKLWKNKRPNI